MNKGALTRVVVLVVAGAAAGYVMRGPSDPSQEAASVADRSGDGMTATPPGIQRKGTQTGSSAESSAGSLAGLSTAAVPPDPRLDVFKVSSDNGLIEFVVGDNGKVIKEVDKNPNSIGFGKPTREYSYFGNRVVELTAYQYLGHTTQVTKTMVAYNPDGSVQDIKETTGFVGPEKRGKR